MTTKAILFITSFLISFAVSAQHINQLIPDFATLQYAGSIGYLSAGAGYDVFESKARFSTHFGVVPVRTGGQLNVVSIKFFYKPITLTVWNRVRMNPIDIGIMASYHYGNKFETHGLEGEYPKGYYWWHPAFRTHLAIENSVTYEFKKGHRFTSITGYIEFNTNELYFISFIRNMRIVSLWDVIKIGTGARLTF